MIACPHRPPCPGCPRFGVTDVDASARAALEALATAHGIAPPRIVRGASAGFRHRARLAVRGRATTPKIGIFEAGSHRVVDIPRCAVHHPRINEVAAELRHAIVDTHTAPYSDDAHRGLVRYLQVVVERSSGTAQVVLVTNSDAPDACAPLFASLAERLGPRLHSLFWNGNSARTNTILGPSWAHLRGPAHVEERIGGARVFYPPGAFGQGNLDLADSIVSTVHGWVPEGSRILELYAGVGPIGLGLVRRAASVTFNEVAPESLAGLEQGRGALDAELRARTRVVPGPATTMVGSLAEADVIVVDPPRKGLDRPLREALASAPPDRLLYVACGLGSFLADAEALTARGSLRLAELSAFDLFPYTEHVEVAARFERRADD